MADVRIDVNLMDFPVPFQFGSYLPDFVRRGMPVVFAVATHLFPLVGFAGLNASPPIRACRVRPRPAYCQLAKPMPQPVPAIVR